MYTVGGPSPFLKVTANRIDLALVAGSIIAELVVTFGGPTGATAGGLAVLRTVFRVSRLVVFTSRLKAVVKDPVDKLSKRMGMTKSHVNFSENLAALGGGAAAPRLRDRRGLAGRGGGGGRGSAAG